MRFIGLLFMLSCSCSCLDIKYADDKAFIPSAAANSLEFGVHIGKTLCKDMDGIIGICSKRVTNKTTITFSQDPLPYSYQFFLTCSKEIESDFSKDVPAKTPFSFEITPNKFNHVLSFICIGRIVPSDRTELDAKWEVRIKVMDDAYVPRESMYLYKQYLLLGKYAHFARVFHDGHWWRYKDMPYIKVKNTEGIMAWSESYNMRYNYFNWK